MTFKRFSTIGTHFEGRRSRVCGIHLDSGSWLDALADTAPAGWLSLRRWEILQLMTQAAQMSATGNTAAPLLQPLLHFFPVKIQLVSKMILISAIKGHYYS